MCANAFGLSGPGTTPGEVSADMDAKRECIGVVIDWPVAAEKQSFLRLEEMFGDIVVGEISLSRGFTMRGLAMSELV